MSKELSKDTTKATNSSGAIIGSQKQKRVSVSRKTFLFNRDTQVAVSQPLPTSSKPAVSKSVSQPAFVARRTVGSRQSQSIARTLSDLYPQHEQLKAANLALIERKRVEKLLRYCQGNNQISDEIELLAWQEMMTLRGKLSLRELRLHPIRNKLYEKFITYAYEIASAYYKRLPYRPLADLGDLYDDACMGLANCVDVFDCSRFSPFEPCDSFRKFSRPRIKGAIIDGLRTMQPFSRSISKLKREVSAMMIRLGNQLGHNPTHSEFADFYGDEWWEVLNNPLLHANVYNQVSGKMRASERSSGGGSNTDQNETDCDNGAFASAIVEDTVNDSLQGIQLDNVDDICRDVFGEDTIHYEVIFFYFEIGMNLREIAGTLRGSGKKISIPQVNKIKREAISKLRSVPGLRKQLEAITRKE